MAVWKFHAVELYLKAVLVNEESETDVSEYGHSIKDLLANVQATHPANLSRKPQVIRLRSASEAKG